MGYQHIENLYRNRDILLFKECYALEKIHGSSGNISHQINFLKYFCGGCKQEEFEKLFNHKELLNKFKELRVKENISNEYPIICYGETYGGKMQRMSKTYGPILKFVAFEVKIGERWLSVPDAEAIVKSLGLEFVHYKKIPATLEAMTQEMMEYSVQAVRNGMGLG